MITTNARTTPIRTPSSAAVTAANFDNTGTAISTAVACNNATCFAVFALASSLGKLLPKLGKSLVKAIDKHVDLVRAHSDGSGSGEVGRRVVIHVGAVAGSVTVVCR